MELLIYEIRFLYRESRYKYTGISTVPLYVHPLACPLGCTYNEMQLYHTYNICFYQKLFSLTVISIRYQKNYNLFRKTLASLGFFNVKHDEGGKPKKRAFCKKCKFKTEITRSNTSNLVRHLVNNHFDDYNNAKELQDKEKNLKQNL